MDALTAWLREGNDAATDRPREDRSAQETGTRGGMDATDEASGTGGAG